MRHRRFRRLLAVALVVAGTALATPAAPVEAAGTCGQAPQKPYSFDRLTINWGSLVICTSPIVTSTFVGLLENEGGIIFDAKAGPGTLPLASVQFWSNTTVCPLPGNYKSVIVTATLVLLDGTVVTLGPQDSGTQFVNCLL